MHLTHLENDESIDMIESVSGDLWDPIEEYGQEGQSSKTETQEETMISVSQRKFFVKNWTFYIFPWNVSEKASYDDEQHLPEELQETRGKIPETDRDSAFRSTLSSPKSSKREFC